MLSSGKIISQNREYPYAQIKEDSLEFVYSYDQQKKLKVSVLAKENCYAYTNKLLQTIDTMNVNIETLSNDKTLLLENEVTYQKIVSEKNKVIDSQEQAILILQSDVNRFLINNVELNTKYLNQKESATKWKGFFWGLVGTITAAGMTMILK